MSDNRPRIIIEPGQRWQPSPKPRLRAKARHVLWVFDADDPDRAAVRYAVEGDGVTTMQLRGFRDWIRTMDADVTYPGSL